MKKFSFILLFLPCIAQANCADTSFCNVKVTRVYDGDTFFVDLPRLHKILRHDMGIRVKGVNTPELRAKSEYEKQMAKKAKEFTISALINARKVDLKNCEKGKYFRLVCDVFYDDASLARELIARNLGVVYEE